MGPGGPKDGPWTPPGRPRRAKINVKKAQDCRRGTPGLPQGGPIKATARPQDGPGGLEPAAEVPQRLPAGPHDALGGPQEAPRGLQEAPRTARDGPDDFEYGQQVVSKSVNNERFIKHVVLFGGCFKK